MRQPIHFLVALTLTAASAAVGLGEGVLVGLFAMGAAWVGGFDPIALPRRRRLAPAPRVESGYETRIYQAFRLHADRLEVLPLVVTAPRGSHRLVWAARAAARLVALKGMEYSYYRLR